MSPDRPKPFENVWAYKRQKNGEVTIHRGDEDRFTDVDGWVTICDRIIPELDHRWIWAEYRTFHPDRTFLCRRCWT